MLGINQDPVTIKNVEVAIIDRAWESHNVRPQPPEWLSGKTVAVIGSGPAGLAAAQQLTRAGHTVAVYERADKIGGLLRYGIPEFKMEKSVLDRRLDQMRREGTVFRAGVNVGETLTGDQLRDRYDAVVLAMGATEARELPATGRELGGIHQAMEYLPQSNRASLGEEVEDQIRADGKHVVIIGGGDTGADCLGTATRQHAKTITQLEIMERPGEERPANQPWPTYPMIFRVSSAHEEGGDRVYSVSTKEFLGDDDGNVRALQLVEVELRGREVPARSRAPSARSRPSWCCSRWASPVRRRKAWSSSSASSSTSAATSPATTATSRRVDGVFVAGDVGRGQSLIVWAIAEGRAAAAAVDTWLSGEHHPARPDPARPSARSSSERSHVDRPGPGHRGTSLERSSRSALGSRSCGERRSCARSGRRPPARSGSGSSSMPAWTSPG